MDERVVRIASLDAIAVGRMQAPAVVCVLLHGFAMEPSDLAPFAHSLGVPGLFVFPRGPLDAEVAAEARRGRAWWRVDALRRAESMARGPRDFYAEYPDELDVARDALAEALRALPSLGDGIAECPLLLGGFSQGGMLACDAFLRGGAAASGLALLSSSRVAFADWAPFLERSREEPDRFPPVLISHGEGDQDLAFSAGERLRDALVHGGAQVDWVPFAGGHEIPLPVWRRIRKLLTSGLRKPEALFGS